MHIAPTLRFQGPTFLANYAAMQQTPTILSAEPAVEPQADDQHSGQNTPASESPAELLVLPVEVGGREGPEPTRYGDWERAGRCIDF